MGGFGASRSIETRSDFFTGSGAFVCDKTRRRQADMPATADA